MKNKISINPEDLETYTRTTKKEISKCYKILKDIPPFGSLNTTKTPESEVRIASNKLKLP